MINKIEYLYEDEDILVCHKPAGMATEGATVGRMDLISRVRNDLARKDNMNNKGRQRNLPPYVATVNRLDAPVEGVLVLAKNKKAAGNLAGQIKDHRTEKYYYALCYGNLENKSGSLKDMIIRKESDGLAGIITEAESKTYEDNTVTLSDGNKIRTIGGEPKVAQLEYREVYYDGPVHLLQIHLLTGRYHQIRAQLSNMGIPILGDDRYASPESKAYSESSEIKNVCLAAYKFSFKHPGTGKKLTFEITPHNKWIAERL